MSDEKLEEIRKYIRDNDNRIEELENSRKQFLKILEPMKNLINIHTKEIAELKKKTETRRDMNRQIQNGLTKEIEELKDKVRLYEATIVGGNQQWNDIAELKEDIRNLKSAWFNTEMIEIKELKEKVDTLPSEAWLTKISGEKELRGKKGSSGSTPRLETPPRNTQLSDDSKPESFNDLPQEEKKKRWIELKKREREGNSMIVKKPAEPFSWIPNIRTDKREDWFPMEEHFRQQNELITEFLDILIKETCGYCEDGHYERNTVPLLCMACPHNEAIKKWEARRDK